MNIKVVGRPDMISDVKDKFYHEIPDNLCRFVLEVAINCYTIHDKQISIFFLENY
jgi:hypothetical protein